MSERTLIKGGHLIDPANSRNDFFDLLIENGKIQTIERPGQIPVHPGTQAIDATGSIVSPGFVDMHTHLREPGFEHKETIETGTHSAMVGGYTSIACMANTNPINDNAFVTTYILERAKSRGHVKVYPVGAITKGLQGEELAEIGSMINAGCVAISDDGICVMNAYLMRKALDYSRAFDIPVLVHAEDENLVGKGVINEGIQSTVLGLRGIPAEAEEIIVARDIALAAHTKAKLHICHISSASSIELVRRAKNEGLSVTCEVTPHHLHLTELDIGLYNTNCRCRPPLRTLKDVEACRLALGDGTIDCIATDHAPHSPEEKEVVFENAANGIIGMETALPLGIDLVKKGYLTLYQLIERLSSSPAKILGIEAGSLSEGKPADLVIFNPEQKYTYSKEMIHSKSRNSPFVGWNLTGRVERTLLDGRTIFLEKNY